MRSEFANKIRHPAVAGMFYPAAEDQLSATVESHLSAVADPHAVPKAVIAPHAGYVYSGPIAGTAYAPFIGRGDTIRRVVLLGPSHRVPFRGIAVSGADAFVTPLGEVPVDKAAVEAILRLPNVGILDAAHAEEHSLEVHLPFLQRLFPDFSLVPVVVGDAAAEDVERLLATLWGGPETLIVVSSDLSHFHDYETAQRLDRDASRAIELLRPDLLLEEHACGLRPIHGLLRLAQALDLRATAVDMRSSGDTAGSRDQVVGYGAYMFEDAATARLSERHRAQLKQEARASIRHGVERGEPAPVVPDAYARPLQAVRATFVTVMLDGRLRGCIGSLTPTEPLVADVVQNAYKACFSDPRFPPVTVAEAGRLEIGISILSTPRPVPAESEQDLIGALRVGEDGLILREGDRRSLFLPQVWESLRDPVEFLGHLKEKAGFERGYWSPRLTAQRFTTESF